ncbi:MAG: hypothetical protein ACKO03_00125, partial [Bacteroidota bacterium]
MRNYSKEELDDLLKEKSEQYLLYPSDTVWKNIQRELHPRNGWLSASFAALLLIASMTAIWVKKEVYDNTVPVSKATAYRFVELPSVVIRSSVVHKRVPLMASTVEQRSVTGTVAQVEKSIREDDAPIRPPLAIVAP